MYFICSSSLKYIGSLLFEYWFLKYQCYYIEDTVLTWKPITVLFFYQCWGVLKGTAFEEMETFVFLFSFSALGILYAMNSIPAFQE